MKTILFTLLSCLVLNADPAPTRPSQKVRVTQGWSAYDVTGINIPVYQAPGDLITVDFPNRYAKAPLLSFATIPRIASIAGKTITATIQITASPGSVYSVSSTGGWSIPPNVRIYFTTRPGNYRYSEADKYDTSYWWSDTAFVHLTEDVVNGLAASMMAMFTAPLNPTEWSDALGHSATESPFYTAAFNAAADAPAQFGFSFGSGSFFDTGVGEWLGSITFHVLSYSVQ